MGEKRSFFFPLFSPPIGGTERHRSARGLLPTRHLGNSYEGKKGIVLETETSGGHLQCHPQFSFGVGHYSCKLLVSMAPLNSHVHEPRSSAFKEERSPP